MSSSCRTWPTGTAMPTMGGASTAVCSTATPWWALAGPGRTWSSSSRTPTSPDFSSRARAPVRPPVRLSSSARRTRFLAMYGQLEQFGQPAHEVQDQPLMTITGTPAVQANTEFGHQPFRGFRQDPAGPAPPCLKKKWVTRLSLAAASSTAGVWKASSGRAIPRPPQRRRAGHVQGRTGRQDSRRDPGPGGLDEPLLPRTRPQRQLYGCRRSPGAAARPAEWRQHYNARARATITSAAFPPGGYVATVLF